VLTWDWLKNSFKQSGGGQLCGLPMLVGCLFLFTSYDLLMSKIVRDIFVANFLYTCGMILKHVTIGVFEK
jgi:hypothetical protein